MTSNPGYRDNKHEATPYDRQTLAALFDTPEQAKTVLKRLHEAKFSTTWMGVTAQPEAPGVPSGYYNPSSGELIDQPRPVDASAEHQVETAAGGGFGGAVARFFGESTESLPQALIRQGIPESDAHALDHQMRSGGAVITVKVEDRYDEALQILKQDHAAVASVGASPVTPAASATAPAPATAPATTSSVPTSTPLVDADEQTMQLREERLAIDKQRVSAGEATIEKKVVSQQTSVDVPLMHEELFIQRHAVADGATVSTQTIGTDQTITVPLMREQVVVDKRTFVTEEVEIGKRVVTENQHINDTVRHEELVLDDKFTPRP